MIDAAIDKTDFLFSGQKAVYHGKVRDVYDFGSSLVFVATDRYSAFDRNLALVPQKGALLTAISRWWFEKTADIVPNHVIDYPDPNVTRGRKYTVIPIEMIVRGYITGVTNTSLWHTYDHGQRDYGSFKLPDGLRKNQKLPGPVLTPTTKFEAHDRNLTPEEAVAEGLLDQPTWERLQQIALDLFSFGQSTAADHGLILVDTKYEFGQADDGTIILIDEIHTPDSSRYWRADTYQASLDSGAEPDNYDKEFLRLWYKQRFDPYAEGTPPAVPPAVVLELADRYMYVYARLHGKPFVPLAGPAEDMLRRIEENVASALGKPA